MTNEQILKKVIEKAIKNGYHCSRYLIKWIEEEDEQWGTLMNSTSVETIIFSHDFAKAFWGEQMICSNCGNLAIGDERYCNECWERYITSWQYHLQQMVLEEDPIKYLEKFL